MWKDRVFFLWEPRSCHFFQKQSADVLAHSLPKWMFTTACDWVSSNKKNLARPLFWFVFIHLLSLPDQVTAWRLCRHRRQGSQGAGFILAWYFAGGFPWASYSSLSLGLTCLAVNEGNERITCFIGLLQMKLIAQCLAFNDHLINVNYSLLLCYLC